MTPDAPATEPNLSALMQREEELHAKAAHRRHLANVTLVIPPVAGVVLLIVAAVVKGPGFAGALVTQAIFIFTVAGKFAILQAVLGDVGFTAVELAALVAYMDISIAVVLVYNLPRLYRLKRVGPTLEDLAEHGLYMLEQKPWLGRVTFAGVIAFVMFPLTGTGAIGGSIFGRLLGLSARRTLAAIGVGACLGSFGMAFFGETVRSVFTPEMQQSWQFKATGIVVLAAMIGVVWWRGRKVTQELRARRAARQTAANASSPVARP